MILKPSSWFLSPRALHSVNVFLIKLTSFPSLVIIGLYERYFASGQRFRETGKGAAQSLFNSLPRHIKNMPLVEALVGSASNDLYEAIFDVQEDNASGVMDIFDESDDELPHLRSYHSRENIDDGNGHERRRAASLGLGVRVPFSPPSGRVSRDLSPAGTARNSALLSAAEIPTTPRSPLGRMFSRGSATESVMDATARKVDALVDDLRDLSVHKLKDEMKELQVRYLAELFFYSRTDEHIGAPSTN